MKTLFLVMFLGTSLYPQSQGGITNGPTAEFRIQAGFSSLPPWPANGVPLVERYPKETYLFIDVATGDYIAYFPESLSPAMAHSKAFRTVRIPLGNKARAQATVRVTRSSAGEFVYDYTVTNKRESTYPLMSWLVAAEVDDESLTMGHPTWRKYGESASVVAARTGVAAPALPSIPKGPSASRLLMWSTIEQEHPLRPGATGDGFQVRSRYSPGLTIGYFVGGPPLAFGHALPEPVMLQLSKHLGRDKECYKDFVIGPRFAPERSVLWKAAEWHVGLQQLVHARAVNDKSPFIMEVLRTLDDLVQHENAAVPIGETRAKFVFKVTAAPTNDYEQQLLSALVACFE